MVKSFARRIGLTHFVHRRRSELSYLDEEATSVVPDDVGEGYFAVVANKDGESKRFIVGLVYLADPVFLGLLDQAEEEYGFMHQGAIAIPCRPQELQGILDSQRASIEL